MKICWDNLENIRLNSEGNFKNITTNRKLIYTENCKNCNEPFLARTDNKNGFCSIKCSKIGRKRSNETRRKISESLSGENNPMYGKHHSEETRRKISESEKGKITPKGKNSHTWRGGYHSNNIPAYDVHASQISWCESVRRSKNDENILEVKCAYCGKWYKPTLTSIRNRIQILNGNENYDGEHRLYCSESCKFECPIYNKVKWPKGFKMSTSREVQPQLRQMVLERDNYECQKCGSTESLHCHHLEGIHWNPLESADIDKCITLCKSCHIEVHKLPDCSPYDMRCAA